MKKLLSVLLSITLISTFCCACQSGNKGNSDIFSDSLPDSNQSESLQPSDTLDSESQDAPSDETSDEISDKTSDSESDWSEWA